MISSEDREAIGLLLAELDSQESLTDGELVDAVARLPANLELLDQLVLAAKERNSRWADRLRVAARHQLRRRQVRERPTTGPDPQPTSLASLLASGGRITAKINTLLAAARSADPSAVDAVRRRLACEENPFVLATMASFLGRTGGPEDANALLALVDHDDERVAANALQAINELRLDVPIDRALDLANRKDGRMRANALVVLGRLDPGLVLERIGQLLECAPEDVRGSIAYVLGEMAPDSPVLERIFSMFRSETAPGVLRHVATSLAGHIRSSNKDRIIGELYELRRDANEEKLALVNTVIQEVGVSLGLVESEVDTIGQDHLAALAATSAQPDLVEDDAPLSFAEIWGIRPLSKPGTVPGTVPTLVPPPSAFRQRHAAPAALALITGLATGWITGGPLPAAALEQSAAKRPVSRQLRLAASSAPRTPSSRRAPPPLLPAAEGGGGSRVPSYAPHPVSGTTIDLDGTVVFASTTKVILRCRDRFFVLRGGRAVSRLTVGQSFRGQGRAANIAANGLIYVDVEV